MLSRIQTRSPPQNRCHHIMQLTISAAFILAAATFAAAQSTDLVEFPCIPPCLGTSTGKIKDARCGNIRTKLQL